MADQNNDGTVNVNETRFYVDGVPDPISSSVSRAVNTTAGVVPSIGGSNQAANYNFKGDIDDVRIFPRPLTPLEIVSLGTASNSLPPGLPEDDNDGDGATNAQELIAGTDPVNAASVFRITASSASTEEMILHWPAVQGKTYVVEESGDMTNWSEVPGIAPIPAAANDPDSTVVIPMNSQPRRFLRLGVR